MKILITLFLFAATALAADKKPIILVLTNHGEMGQTGKPTGFYLSEVAHPYEVFKKADYPVILASPKGGFAPVDPKSLDLEDKANKSFWEEYGVESNGRKGVTETISLDTLEADEVSAVFYAGGHGTMWDLPNSKVVQSFTSQVYTEGGAVGAVCHGPAALVGVTDKLGEPLVENKKVAVFTNKEEEAVGLTSTVPFLLEDAMEEAGAKVQLADNFTENAVRDGRLVTGQNPASAKKAGELLIEAIESGE